MAGATDPLGHRKYALDAVLAGKVGEGFRIEPHTDTHAIIVVGGRKSLLNWLPSYADPAFTREANHIGSTTFITHICFANHRRPHRREHAPLRDGGPRLRTQRRHPGARPARATGRERDASRPRTHRFGAQTRSSIAKGCVFSTVRPPV